MSRWRYKSIASDIAQILRYFANVYFCSERHKFVRRQNIFSFNKSRNNIMLTLQCLNLDRRGSDVAAIKVHLSDQITYPNPIHLCPRGIGDCTYILHTCRQSLVAPTRLITASERGGVNVTDGGRRPRPRPRPRRRRRRRPAARRRPKTTAAQIVSPIVARGHLVCGLRADQQAPFASGRQVPSTNTGNAIQQHPTTPATPSSTTWQHPGTPLAARPALPDAGSTVRRPPLLVSIMLRIVDCDPRPWRTQLGILSDSTNIPNGGDPRVGGRWTVDSGWWIVDGGWWTVDGGRWTADGGRWTVDGGTMDGGRWTSDGGRRTVDVGRWTVDGGRWTVDGGRWTVDGGRWTADVGRWTVDGGQRTSTL